MAAPAVEVPQIQFIGYMVVWPGSWSSTWPWKNSTYFLREAGLRQFFLRAPCVWQCVSPQLLLEELRTLLAGRRENLHTISMSPSYLTGGTLRCAMTGLSSASAPGAFGRITHSFLRERELES